MSRRSGRGAQPEPRADLQAEVVATTTAIASLRRRLRHPGMFEHPTVRRELRKLEDLLVAFDQTGRSPGRHRAQGGRLPGSNDSQRASETAKPDPATARTAADYVAALRQFRAWSGDVPWRTIAARAKQKRVHSTIYDAMRRDDLPTLEVVKAVIIGCGGDQNDLVEFTSAWQRISSATATGQDGRPDHDLPGHDRPGHLPAPVPALTLQPGT